MDDRLSRLLDDMTSAPEGDPDACGWCWLRMGGGQSCRHCGWDKVADADLVVPRHTEND